MNWCEHYVLSVKVLSTVGANSLTQFQFMKSQYLGSILSQTQEVSIEVTFFQDRSGHWVYGKCNLYQTEEDGVGYI